MTRAPRDLHIKVYVALWQEDSEETRECGRYRNE
jgi:hypothetical protein